MTSRTTRLAAIAAVAALGLAACGDDGNDEDSTPATAAAESESTADAGTAEGAETGNIVEVAAGAEDFSTLVAAVEAAGLVDTLSGPGPYTVFAPTNEAFEAAFTALGITADELLADTETLTEILTYHVLAGEVDAATAISLDGQTAETLNGADISINVVDDNVLINDATVILPDIEASNGIIHGIDMVLLPPHDGDDMSEEMSEDAMSEEMSEDAMSEEMSEDDMSEEMSEEMAEELGSIVEVAAEAGAFTTLLAAAESAGLAETLDADGPFTVFAPTDEAFEAALADLGITAEELLADTETLTSILTYHVVDGAVFAEDVVTLDGQSVTTLNGADVVITVDGDTVLVNEATVTAVDAEGDNGVIHVIDAVLLPPAS